MIDFDLSFPDLSCNLLSVDAVDDTGLSMTDAVHEVYKHKLTPIGAKFGFPQRQELGNTVRTEKELAELVQQAAEQAKLHDQIGSCGNCYGAGTRGQCCNTCQEVKDAYARLGWRFKQQGVVQCAAEDSLVNLKDQYAEEGGCQVYGRVQLSKASGHFHIAPHRKTHTDHAQNGMLNLLDLISFTFDQFNVSHTVNGLSFGDHFPGIQSPLDGQERTVLDTHGMYQYYIKVVPTKFKGIGAISDVSSNQYSVTEHCSHLAPGSGRGLPGVYFYYEVSPIQAHIEEKKKSLFGFLTSLCAIVGGAYSVMGLVDLTVTGFLRYFYHKSYLGG